MVKSVINGITTYYASSSYVMEVDGSDTTVRKTYTAGSTSLAVRTIVNGTENTLNWLLSDHLGSSSITTTANGTWNSELRYSAFGETRYSSGITPTDYRYTGQLQQADVNLYYYNARYYDAALGRFVQADTIVQNPGSVKSYDRYTYVNNNPLKYTDPSGHKIEEGAGYVSPVTDWEVFTKVEVARRKSIADKIIKSENVICSGWGCVAGLMFRGYMNEDRAVISGEGVSLLANDPRLLELQEKIVNQVRNDPRYGKENFLLPDMATNYGVTFGDEGGGMLQDATHPATWMVRAAAINADVLVTKSGEIVIDYELNDVLDLRPDWDDERRNKSKYNDVVTVLGFVWHDLDLATDQLEVYAHWWAIIPSENKNE